MIVYNRARLHRDSTDAALTKRALRAAGAVLVSVMDYTEDTYIGDLVAHILDGVNEYQSRASGADIALKMAGKAERGGTLGVAKIGYLNIRETFEGREIRTIGIDPERAPFIRMLFELYATGKHSYKDLQKAVTIAGLRTRSTKRYPAGTTLSINKIGRILRDRYYLGYVNHKGTEYPGRHEPLVDEELFNRVQNILYQQRGAGTRERVYDHHLKGGLWCARCQSRLLLDRGKSKSGRLYFYFLCIGVRDRTCRLPRIPVALVEQEIERHFDTLHVPATLADDLRSALSIAAGETTQVTQTAKRQLQKERKRLDTMEDQYLDLIGDPNWPKDKLTAKMQEIRRQREAVDAQMADIETDLDLAKAQTTINDIIALLDQPRRLYAAANEHSKRFIIRSFFTALYIDAPEPDQPQVTADQIAARSPRYCSGCRTFPRTEKSALTEANADHVVSTNNGRGLKRPGVELMMAYPNTWPPRCCGLRIRHLL